MVRSQLDGKAARVYLPRRAIDYHRVTRVDRLKPLLVSLALIGCLVAPSPPTIPGDGAEYLTLALNFAAFKGPSIAPADLRDYLQQLTAIKPDIDPSAPNSFARIGKDGSVDYLHFWFYSLLATPGIWITQLVGLPPTYGFALLNVALILLALAVSIPRLGTATCILLFASPVIWWIDKPHTEPYTFALLMVGIVLIDERPWWAVLAAGLAAVQNPVALAFLGLLLAAGLLQGRRVFRDWRWLAAATAGTAVASLHVIYFWVRYRTPFPIAQTTQAGVPDLTEILVPLVDPNVGLVANVPMLAIVTVGALGVVAWRRPSQLARLDVAIACAAGLAFLLGFARNTNYHHGGTPSISRYALWLIPLTVPVLRQAATVAGRWWRGGVWTAAMISAAASVYAFHPIVVQNGREPTWAADYLWRGHPLWNDPLPQTFIESQRRTEDPLVPIATRGCEKILIYGQPGHRVWPVPCYPEPLPAWCLNDYCYANLVNARYVFTGAPGRSRGPGRLLEYEAWPVEAEPRVREFYTRMSWWTLRAGLDPDPMFRQVAQAHATYLQGPTSTIVVLQEAARGAVVRMRPPRPYTATLVDPVAGQVKAVLSFEGPAFEMWEIPIPESEVLLLGLAPSTSGPR